MSTPLPTDKLLTQRGPTLYAAPADMSTIQPTDLLLVARGGVNYKCLASDFGLSKATPPVIGTVTLADSPEAGRFTSGSFATTLAMTSDGNPASVRGIKAYVEGSLKARPQSGEIVEVTTSSGSKLKELYAGGNAKADWEKAFDGTGGVNGGTANMNSNYSEIGIDPPIPFDTCSLLISQNYGINPQVNGVDVGAFVPGNGSERDVTSYLTKKELSSITLYANGGNQTYLRGVKINGQWLRLRFDSASSELTTLTLADSSQLDKFAGGDAVKQDSPHTVESDEIVTVGTYSQQNWAGMTSGSPGWNVFKEGVSGVDIGSGTINFNPPLQVKHTLRLTRWDGYPLNVNAGETWPIVSGGLSLNGASTGSQSVWHGPRTVNSIGYTSAKPSDGASGPQPGISCRIEVDGMPLISSHVNTQLTFKTAKDLGNFIGGETVEQKGTVARLSRVEVRPKTGTSANVVVRGYIVNGTHIQDGQGGKNFTAAISGTNTLNAGGPFAGTAVANYAEGQSVIWDASQFFANTVRSFVIRISSGSSSGGTYEVLVNGVVVGEMVLPDSATYDKNITGFLLDGAFGAVANTDATTKTMVLASSTGAWGPASAGHTILGKTKDGSGIVQAFDITTKQLVLTASTGGWAVNAGKSVVGPLKTVMAQPLTSAITKVDSGPWGTAVFTNDTSGPTSPAYASSKIFDADLSNYAMSASGGGTNITCAFATPVSIAKSCRLKALAHTASLGGASHAANPDADGWTDCPSFVGKQISAATPLVVTPQGTNSPTLGAIEVDGIILQDGGSTVLTFTDATALSSFSSTDAVSEVTSGGGAGDAAGKCASVAVGSLQMQVGGTTGAWTVGSKVVGPTKPASKVKLYCKLDPSLNVTDLSSVDPGYTGVTGFSPYTVTFPATLPTGAAPDVDLPAGTSLTTEVQAVNASATVTKTSNTVVPT